MDKDVEVEEIIEEILENVRKKSSSISTVQSIKTQTEEVVYNSHLAEKIEQLKEYEDIHVLPSKPIEVGKWYIKKIRRLLHQEIRYWLLFPVLDKQTSFNTKNRESIELINSEIQNLMSYLENLRRSFNSITEDNTKNRESIELINSEIQNLMSYLENLRRSFNSITEDNTKNRESIELINSEIRKLEAEEKFDMDLVAFEDRFRGSSEYVTGILNIFVKYFHGCKQVVDLGCGRGEFLELLQRERIGAYGVDKEPAMVSICKSKGLSVMNADAIEHLKSLPNACLDGAFASSFVEHLKPGYLVNLLKLLGDKMKSESYLIITTPNPLNLYIFRWAFFIDLTHVRPIHPDLLRYLLVESEFRPIDTIPISPVPESDRLQRIDGSFSKQLQELVEVYNKNIEKLNESLFGYQDYAIIAKHL